MTIFETEAHERGIDYHLLKLACQEATEVKNRSFLPFTPSLSRIAR